jgi:hypothetical protein
MPGPQQNCKISNEKENFLNETNPPHSVTKISLMYIMAWIWKVKMKQDKTGKIKHGKQDPKIQT